MRDMLFNASACLESTVNKGLTYFQQLFQLLHDDQLFHWSSTSWYADNKGADQLSLNSAFVTRLLFCFYLRRFNESRSSNGSTPSIHPSARLSVRNTFGCLAGVICNNNSFHSFISNLCIMISYTLKVCIFYLVQSSCFLLHFLGSLTLSFFCKMFRGCLVCVQFSFFNIQTLHYDWSYIEQVHLLFCAHLIHIFRILGLFD